MSIFLKKKKHMKILVNDKQWILQKNKQRNKFDQFNIYNAIIMILIQMDIFNISGRGNIFLTFWFWDILPIIAPPNDGGEH